nr:class I SAM-dependent methyltransferase [Pseudomonas piscis]
MKNIINRLSGQVASTTEAPVNETEEQRRKARTAEHWSQNQAGSDPFSADVYWRAVPAIQRRHQQKATAGSGHDYWVSYCLDTFLGGRLPVARMLSVGCGTGDLERDLYNLKAFQHCDALDIAPAALDTARAQATALGAGSIDYQLLDIERTALPSAHYDAVWFNGSMHHIRELESVCANVRQALKPDGWLFLNEYLGANHFAFDEIQCAAISHAFALIPPSMRHSFVQGSHGQVQNQVPLPDPLEVVKVDPSEAVRSQDILRVVQEHFDIRAFNACGGTLLQFLLHGIAGNFRDDNPQAMRILQMLFDIEDGLIESGTLHSDFAIVAATPKPWGAAHGSRP